MQQDKERVEELTDWVQLKLRFIEGVIREARQSSNYGKEIQYVGMQEAYLEFLTKLGAEAEPEEAESEQAA